MYTGKQIHRYAGIRNTRFAVFVFILYLSSFILSSCGTPAPAALTPPFSAPFVLGTRDPNTLPTPTATVTATETLTLTPTAPPTATLTATLPPDLTSGPSPTGSADPPLAIARPQYTIYATIDYDGHTAAVDEGIVYPNQTGVTLNELVLAVEPMLYNDAFHMTSLFINGFETTNYVLDTHRLTVPLPQPLPPGTQVTLTIQYDLNIPFKQKANTFGWLSYQTSLTEWYPFVVPYDAASGWILHDYWAFGEHLVYDSSDFDVNIRFTDPSNPPIIAAPAPAEANGEWTRFRLYGARAFVLSMSREFLYSESAVGPVIIRSYYFSGHEAAGEKVLYVAKQAVAIYEAKFAPYPYQTLSVVELNYNDGQEYDGLAFLADSFYAQYDGGAQNNLATIGVHEIAHNWWFGLVGSDQALEPWLDEAMALYSEHIFYEFNYPYLVDWWWQFRVNYFGPSGWVDTTIYNGGTFRAYTNAVYLNGGTFIDDIRVRIGDEDFFRFLKAYAGQMSYRRATAADFFAILRQSTSKDVSDLISAYFANLH
ncbi:MAG: M1 family aminopeptidase [Chloroflexota bacterium]